MEKNCTSCGMPLKKKDDYPNHDETKTFCKFCATDGGILQGFEERLNSMSEFIMKTQGFDQEAARTEAKNLMTKMPAWKKHFE